MYTIKIAHFNEFKEQNVKIIIHNGTPIAVIKDENKYYAIDNRCPHRGASLGEGPIQNEIITCKWHSWKFSLKTGQAIENPNCFIKTFPIIIEGELIKLVYDS